MIFPLGTGLLESCIFQLKRKEKSEKNWSLQWSSREQEQRGKEYRGKLCPRHKIVRSLRNNIAEQALDMDIDLGLLETCLISKKETAQKREA